MIANVGFISLLMLAKMMPMKVLGLARSLKLVDDDTLDKVEELVEQIVRIMETGWLPYRRKYTQNISSFLIQVTFKSWRKPLETFWKLVCLE